jgi:hypothetical protein
MKKVFLLAFVIFGLQGYIYALTPMQTLAEKAATKLIAIRDHEKFEFTYNKLDIALHDLAYTLAKSPRNLRKILALEEFWLTFGKLVNTREHDTLLPKMAYPCLE